MKLGSINFTSIESGYDLSNWFSGGGKGNQINDIHLEVEIETNISYPELEVIKQKAQDLCPVYQMITGSGVKVHSNWKIKHIP
jgi:uncharacterized OsmC-like protein